MRLLRQGRGFGRGRGVERIPTTPNIYKGSVPSIGAYLFVPVRNSPSATVTTIWSSKLGEYAMSIFISGIHQIFGKNDATGECSSREVLPLPIDNGKVQFESCSGRVAQDHFQVKTQGEDHYNFWNFNLDLLWNFCLDLFWNPSGMPLAVPPTPSAILVIRSQDPSAMPLAVSPTPSAMPLAVSLELSVASLS